MRVRRMLWATIAAVGFTAPIVWTLASPPALDRVDTPMAPPDAPGDRFTIAFPEIVPGDSGVVHRMPLVSRAPREIMARPEINILMYLGEHKSLHLVTARLDVGDTRCRFESPFDTPVSDGRPLRLTRAGDCQSRLQPPTGELTLTVEMSTGPGPLGVYAWLPPPDHRGAGLLYFTGSAPGVLQGPVALQGSFVDFMPALGMTRANLLSYVWTGSTVQTPVWLALSAIGVLVLAGTYLCPIDPAPQDRGAERLRFIACSAIAAFSLAMAFALSYVVFIPPFQAADENHHLASYAALNGKPFITAEAIEWANSNHVGRITAHADQRFRPRDVGTATSEPARFIEQATDARNSLTTALWTAVDRVLPNLPVRRFFLLIRVLNALIFGMAVALATVLLVALTAAHYPQLLGFPFLFVPTLPFFAMHFSESALATSVYVVFAATLVVAFLGGRDSWTGLPLGLTAAAMFAGARSSLPMLLLVGTTAIARALLGARGEERPTRSALIFWAGAALGGSVAHLIVTDAQLDRIVAMPLELRGHLPQLVETVTHWLIRPWLPWVAAAAGFGIERVLTRPRSAAAPWLRPGLVLMARTVCIAAIVAIVSSFIASLWLDYPAVETIEGVNRPSRAQYVRQVMATMATMFRLTDPSLMLSVSFWGGFGWLDTILSPSFCTFLVVLTALSLIGLLSHLIRTGDASRFVWLALFLCGAAFTLAFYAVSAYPNATLHGRYLTGWFLALLAICWTFPALSGSRWLGRVRPFSKIPRPAVFIPLSLFVHAYSVCVILRRHF